MFGEENYQDKIISLPTEVLKVEYDMRFILSKDGMTILIYQQENKKAIILDNPLL